MTTRRWLSRAAAAAACALIAGACGAANSAAPAVPSGTVGGVGSLPDGFATTTTTIASTTTPATTVVDVTTTTAPPGESLADLAGGNRILLIGDSIISSIARRYGNQACAKLVPQGWRVEVEGETSQQIGFGLEVLDALLDEGWDAFVILLGNNYGGDQAVYQAGLEEMLDRIGPKPVLLLTVTEFEPAQVQVNEVIRAVAAVRTNVVLLDWATISVEAGIVNADGLHLSDHGRDVLGSYIAAIAGTVASGTGECLRSRFTDDTPANDTPATTVRRGGGGPPTTAQPRPTTTTRPATTSSRPATTTTRPATTATPTTPTSTSSGTGSTTATSPPAPTTAGAPTTVQ